MAKATSSKAATNVLRKQSGKTKRRKPGRSRPYDEVQCPEDRLPFYCFGPKGARDCWAPSRSGSDGTLEDVLGQEAMGAFFALLTVRAMTKKEALAQPTVC